MKHERVCAENKNMRSEIDTVRKDLNSTNIALRSSKKEVSHKLEKKLEQLEIQTKDLQEYKKETSLGAPV